MTIETVGARLYVAGDTYRIKDQLKSIGCHWDSDRRQWWIGKAKQADLARIVEGTAASQQASNGAYVPPTKEELAAKTCFGKVAYKGRTYFVVGDSSRTGKLLLTVLDCSISFWAHSGECQWVKRYSAREYRGQTEHQTVGAIRRFVERNKENASSNAETKRCWECGCSFTQHDARANGGDWSDSYCGC